MIDRAAIEAHLAALPIPRDVPQDAIEVFVPEVVALFCKHFDERGWPSEMPILVALPPYQSPSDPLHQRGYAGIDYLGAPGCFLWRQSKAGEPFVKVDPREEFGAAA